MTKDPNFVSVRLPDDVANWLREYATANKLVRADKPNMGGSIIAVVRSAMQGQTISNNVGQSSAAPDVDIDSKINEAVTSAIANLRASINDELVDIKQAIAAISCEATASANFTQALTENKGSSDTNIAESIIEPLPIIEAIANIADPSIERSLDSNALSDNVAATAKSNKRSTKSKAILSRPEALAIAKKSGFNGTGQNIYDWAKAALTAKSEESKLSNREKLAAVGLVAVFTLENKPAWKAKTR